MEYSSATLNMHHLHSSDATETAREFELLSSGRKVAEGGSRPIIVVDYQSPEPHQVLDDRMERPECDEYFSSVTDGSDRNVEIYTEPDAQTPQYLQINYADEFKENQNNNNAAPMGIVEVINDHEPLLSFDDDDEEYGSDVVSGQGDTTVVVYCKKTSTEEDANNIYLDYNNFAREKNNTAASANGQVDDHSFSPSSPPVDISDRHCELCSVTFDEHQELLGHVLEYHPIRLNEQTHKFNCPFCQYSSINRNSVKLHVRRHTKEKPYKCGVCEKTFSQKAGVQQHMRSHKSDKPFICPECGQGFKALNTLNTHVDMRHRCLRPYQCKICKRTFGHSSNLRIHQRTHTKERPFKCQWCDRAFKQQGHLKTHARIHTGERPFSCQHCDSKFTHVGNLKQHTITQHTKQYPYNCLDCRKGFIAPGDFKRHVKHHEQGFLG